MTNFKKKSQAPAPLVRVVKGQYIAGYLPAMPQSSLRVSLLIDGTKLHHQVLLHTKHIFSETLDNFSAAPEWLSAGTPAVVGQIIDVVSAFLLQSGIPVAQHGYVAQGALKVSSEIDLILPALDAYHIATRSGLEWALSIINGGISSELEAAKSSLEAAMSHVKKLAPKGQNSSRFIQAAIDAHIPWRRVAGNVFEFGWGVNARWLDSSFTDQTSVISSGLARNKISTNILLQRLGIPVCRQTPVASAHDAVAAAAQIGYPVVIKPADLDGGLGVAVGLRNADEVRQAFLNASKLSKKVVLERQFIGNDYRLQVFQGKVFWIVQRIPGGVIGDGEHTIAELLDTLNSDPIRGEPGSKSLLKRIYLDDEANKLLSEQGFTADSRPAKNQAVRLRSAANVSSGGTIRPIFEGAHPDNIALVERTANALRLDLAGIDFLIPDITQSWLETGAAICEVNAQPQLFPTLPKELMRKLVSDQGRIPIVVVLGAADAQMHWSECIADLQCEPYCLGVLTPDEVRIGNQVIMRPPLSNFHACGALLSDKKVRACLFFVDDAEFLATGFPFDQFDYLILGSSAPSASKFANANAWRNFAEVAIAMCRGEIVYYIDNPFWDTFAREHQDKKTIAPLKIEQIVEKAKAILRGPV